MEHENTKEARKKLQEYKQKLGKTNTLLCDFVGMNFTLLRLYRVYFLIIIVFAQFSSFKRGSLV